MPGDYVLDPCAGSGSTLAAARHLKRKALGIEIDSGAHALAVVAATRDEEPQERISLPQAIESIV
jgi:site-specific DNA-methyltransferase (adenine-specific)